MFFFFSLVLSKSRYISLRYPKQNLWMTHLTSSLYLFWRFCFVRAETLRTAGR